MQLDFRRSKGEDLKEWKCFTMTCKVRKELLNSCSYQLTMDLLLISSFRKRESLELRILRHKLDLREPIIRGILKEMQRYVVFVESLES